MIRALGIAPRFLRRVRAERQLLIRVAILFAAAHVLLRFRALQQVRHQLAGMAVRLRARAQDPAQLSWVVASINHNLPGYHSCLINALCCEAIAHSSGIMAELKIGAARDHDRHRFHAWVEHRGVVLTGHGHVAFVPLT